MTEDLSLGRRQLMGFTALILLVIVPQLRVSSANSCAGDVPPSFTSDGRPPRAVIVDDGDTLTLPCRVTGTPTPTVSWYRNGIMIDQASVMTDGTLSIRVTEAEAPREGINYYCVATNRIGPVVTVENKTVAALRSRDVHVSVSFFEGFASREAEVPTLEGEDVSLECAFNASNPAPNITWFANDTIVQNTPLSRKIRLLEEGRYLYIPDLTASERGMRYYCQVNNFLENGIPIRAPTTYTLNTDIQQGGITVYNRQSILSARVGEEVVFVFAVAVRETSVFLSCHDTNLVAFGDSTRTSVPVALTEAAKNEDRVNFTCRVFTRPPNSLTAEVYGTIILSGPPANITSPAASSPFQEQLTSGGSLMYSCVSSGSPPPTITWYYNGELQPSRDGTLSIEKIQVQHSGIYQCLARNQFSDDSKTWILEVADPDIGITVFKSPEYEVMSRSQGYVVVVPSGTTDLVVTAIVNSTTVRNVVTCNSCPQVQWKVNGTNITTDSGHTVSSPCNDDFTSPYEFNLSIASIQEETINIYTVEFSLLNTVRESPRLLVTDNCISRITGISGAEEPVEFGNDLELHCTSFEISSTTISWFKEGVILSSNDQFDILPMMNGMSTLRILSMVVKDGDVYTCTTTTECGSDRRNVTIEVQSSGGDGGRDDSGSSDDGGSIGGEIVAAFVSVLVVVAVHMLW